MTTYLNITNDNNKVQISDSYNIIQMTRKGNMNTIGAECITYAPLGRGNGWSNYYAVAWYIAMQADEIISVVKTNDSRLLLTNEKRAGVNGVVYHVIYAFFTDASIRNNVVEIGNSISIYIFGHNVPCSDNYGLRIHDANGNLVFHSGNKTLNVHDFLSQSGTVSQIYDANGRELAVSILDSLGFITTQPFASIAYTFAKFDSAGNISFAGQMRPADMSFTVYSGTLPTLQGIQYISSTDVHIEALIVDVTNF